MQLRGLVLTDFRNYAEASVEFSPGLNLVVGRNGQGKTNLLEAINVLSGFQQELHLDAAWVAKLVALSQALGHHQDIAKQNRRVEIKPADRLQGDFSGEFGSLDQLEK